MLRGPHPPIAQDQVRPPYLWGRLCMISLMYSCLIERVNHYMFHCRVGEIAEFRERRIGVFDIKRRYGEGELMYMALSMMYSMF